MNFVAIDFETANPDLCSICQIGVVEFVNGKIARTWETLVDPQDWFSEANISVHGIEEDDVIGAPTWPQIHGQLAQFLADRIVVHHTAFDRNAVLRASDKHNLLLPACTYLDSSRVVRRAWPEFARSGYGLKSLALHFGLKFKHHNALEDARIAGLIMLQAIEHSGKPIDDWCILSLKSLALTKQPDEPLEINVEGHLYGEQLVFTGSLVVSRFEAATLASRAGCMVADGVTKNTTLLVVGDQDIRKLIGQEKSSKHRKAEALIAKGKVIRIVGESDFFRLIG